jgi:uncharacterized RDD family membrane protein YckC
MSAQPQGPGWWQASDGNWYPPQGDAAPPVQTSYAAPPAYALTPTSNGRRFGAWLLDGLLALVTLGIGWIIWYFVILGNGQSPAKQLLKMRVVKRSTGQRPSYGEMALRDLVGKWVLGSVTGGITTLVGGIMILGESRQGIWDKMVDTIVVDDPNGQY